MVSKVICWVGLQSLVGPSCAKGRMFDTPALTLHSELIKYVQSYQLEFPKINFKNKYIP